MRSVAKAKVNTILIIYWMYSVIENFNNKQALKYLIPIDMGNSNSLTLIFSNYSVCVQDCMKYISHNSLSTLTRNEKKLWEINFFVESNHIFVVSTKLNHYANYYGRHQLCIITLDEHTLLT